MDAMKPHLIAVNTAHKLFGHHVGRDTLTLIVREWFRLGVDNDRIVELGYFIIEEHARLVRCEEQMELWEEEQEYV